MPDYSLIPNTINSIADRVRGLSRDRSAHEAQMQGLALQDAQLGLGLRKQESQDKLSMAKLQREKYLDEPVTFGVAIQSSKLPDEIKTTIQQGTPQDVWNFPTTRRKAFEAYQKLQEQRAQSKEKMLERTSLATQKGLDRQAIQKEGSLNRASREKIARIGLQKTTAKPTDAMNQMKLQAWQDYMQGKATPQQQDMIGINKDPYLTQAAQIVSQDYDTIDKGPDAIVQKVGAIADQLRTNRQQNPNQEAPKELTRDKAIEYLRQTNGDREKAKQLAAQDGYQF
jgi:hypothetical protein